MPLRYGSDSDGPGIADEWLGATTLASLTELNELCLGLIAEQAALRGSCGSALLQLFADNWRTLDAAARRRAAACPYLLTDAGFADPQRWQPSAAAQVGDGGERAYAAFFTVPAAGHVARLVFTYAWHLAHTQLAATRLLFGMPLASAAAIARYTLPQIQTLAECHSGWLAPRWPSRAQLWRELLRAAAAADPAGLERVRLRGLTLLAAEARQAPLPARWGVTPALRAAPGSDMPAERCKG